MGYGHTSFGGKSSNKLLKGFLSVISNSECNKSYDHESELPEGIINSQICAWDPNHERDTWYVINFISLSINFILKLFSSSGDSGKNF